MAEIESQGSERHAAGLVEDSVGGENGSVAHKPNAIRRATCCFCLNICEGKTSGAAKFVSARQSFSEGLSARRGGLSRREGSATWGSGGPISAEARVENLIAIDKNEKLRVAFADWVQLEKYQKSKVNDKEREKSDLVTQVFHIVGFFSVFQGVVLTAVLQLTSQGTSQCGKIWVPSVLSGIAAVVTVIALLEKYMTIADLEKKVNVERAYFQEYSKLVKTLPLKGENFNFDEDVEDIVLTEKPKFWLIFWFKKAPVLVALILLTALFVVSYFVILCDKWV